MNQLTDEIQPVSIESELSQSYLDYAMSVIVGRALPDVRDGLKPVHRRVLYAMYTLGNRYNRAYKKSARIVGDVVGKYHPHGESAVYDCMVRMAQEFSMRYPLVNGQGNFGSIDGDPPAAMRYTEVRMHRITEELLADIDLETVNFVPNYDETETIPEVMPCGLPNLLLNGATGIAVGMATNIPPHNLTETLEACLALIDNPDITLEELIKIIPGPDFPTGAIINGKQGIYDAFSTGKGSVVIRSKTSIEEMDGGRERIVVTELPYQVNKARLSEKIAALVREGKIKGISEIRDESDKDGMRFVIELRRGELAEIVLNHLFLHTQLQISYGVNMVAIKDGVPQRFTLKSLLEAFIEHRREIVTRKHIYLLRKAQERGHILEGLSVALTHIDRVIEIIKGSAGVTEAKEALMAVQWQAEEVESLVKLSETGGIRPEMMPQHYGLQSASGQPDCYALSPEQAQAILEIRLHRLTSMEQSKIFSEYQQCIEEIEEYQGVLSNPAVLMDVIRQHFNELIKEFGDKRRSQIIDEVAPIDIVDLIPPEERVVTLSLNGYIKSQELDVYQQQRRGGLGKTAATIKEQDIVTNLITAHSHDTLLCFTSRGKVYWLKVYQVAKSGRASKGVPIVNLLNLESAERITAVLPIKDYSNEVFVFMATARGYVKKTPLKAFSRAQSGGIRAVTLNDGDRLVGVDITQGDDKVLLCSSAGKASRFSEKDVRSTGRQSRGVYGLRVDANAEVISLIIPKRNDYLFTASKNGYGKLTAISKFPIKRRGGKGMIAMRTSGRNGKLVGAEHITLDNEIMLISNGGVLIRTACDQLPILSRNTQGVRVIKLKKGENLASIARIHVSDNTD